VDIANREISLSAENVEHFGCLSQEPGHFVAVGREGHLRAYLAAVLRLTQFEHLLSDCIKPDFVFYCVRIYHLLF
jgi:hypothetical protein